MLIRTGNTSRLSNFLLWQLAYSENFFEKKLWPDFNSNDYSKIIKKFKKLKEILEIYNARYFKKNINRIFFVSFTSISFFNVFILIISLICLLIIGWVEFNGLISKIFIKKILKVNF